MGLAGSPVAEQDDRFAGVHAVPGGEPSEGGGVDSGDSVDVEVGERFEAGDLGRWCDGSDVVRFDRRPRRRALQRGQMRLPFEGGDLGQSDFGAGGRQVQFTCRGTDGRLRSRVDSRRLGGGGCARSSAPISARMTADKVLIGERWRGTRRRCGWRGGRGRPVAGRSAEAAVRVGGGFRRLGRVVKATVSGSWLSTLSRPRPPGRLRWLLRRWCGAHAPSHASADVVRTQVGDHDHGLVGRAAPAGDRLSARMATGRVRVARCPSGGGASRIAA